MKVLQGETVAADVCAQLEADAHAFKRLHLGPYDGLGQAVGRDAVGQHAAGLRHPVEDRHRMPVLPEEVGRGQPGRAGADHRHALP